MLTLAALAALAGAVVAKVAGGLVRRRPPASLVRVNINGDRVPAVLGGPLLLGALAGLIVASGAAGEVARVLESSDLIPATVIITLGLYVAGLWDDLRGDERPRGFSGHLGALRGGRLTGGLVKALAGGSAGLLAGAIVATDPGTIVRTGLLVALTANLINLMDRAPGRAGKVSLILAGVALGLSSSAWLVVAAGLFGALLALLPMDLDGRAMLGDAGANPLGGVIGLGFALGPIWVQWLAIGLLAAANLASERWSFTDLIARTPWLGRLDAWGRN